MLIASVLSFFVVVGRSSLCGKAWYTRITYRFNKMCCYAFNRFLLLLLYAMVASHKIVRPYNLFIINIHIYVQYSYKKIFSNVFAFSLCSILVPHKSMQTHSYDSFPRWNDSIKWSSTNIAWNLWMARQLGFVYFWCIHHVLMISNIIGHLNIRISDMDSHRDFHFDLYMDLFADVQLHMRWNSYHLYDLRCQA